MVCQLPKRFGRRDSRLRPSGTTSPACPWDAGLPAAKSLWPCGRQPYESWCSIRIGTCRWLAHRFFQGARPVRMHLHRRAVQRRHLHPDAHDPPALQFHEYPVEHTLARPPAHAGVDGVPIAEAFRQASPLALVFHDIQEIASAPPSCRTLPRWRGGRPPMCSYRSGVISMVALG